MSETKKGLLRIIANYARLGLNLGVGLAVVPVLIGWLGEEAFGLISLLGASIGFASLFQEITRRSMIRELAAAWHEDPGELFAGTYASAWLLSAVIALLSLAAFLAVLAFIPVLNIPPDLRGPAMLFVVAQATNVVVVVLFSAGHNMFVVQERFVEYNFWTVAIRASNLISAVILAYAIKIDDVARGLVAHGILWAMISNAMVIGSVVLLIMRDRRLMPQMRKASRAYLKTISGTFGWNSLVQIAMTLHERVPQFIINFTPLGLIGNAVWALAYRFISMVRMATMGVQFGADAIATRISAADSEESRQAVRDFVHVQTRLNAFVAVPVGLAMYVLARPFLELWLGSRVQDPATILPAAVVMTQILAAGITARALSEGWLLILYGAGHVRRYAPLILIGGVLNPVLAIAMVLLMPRLAIFWPAVSFALIMTVVNLLLMPIMGAKYIGMTFLEMIGPIWRPVVATLVAAPVLIVAESTIQNWSLATLGIVGALFGLIYIPVGAVVVLTAQERQRFLGSLRRALGSRSLAAQGAPTSESSTTTGV